MKENKVLLENFLGKNLKKILELKLVAGEKGLKKRIKTGDINRPGLTLAGFYDFFASDRIQIFGLGETAYLRQLAPETKIKSLEKFFSYDLLCCIFTHGEKPDQLCLDLSNQKNIPLFVTSKETTRFTGLLVHALDDLLAPKTNIHATLVDVFGLGVLFTGKSGVGKSEAALELVERGHRLVADDTVEIKKIDSSLLIGKSNPLLSQHMEIRGLGIINLKDIYGVKSVKKAKTIDFVVILEDWDSSKEYDRLGLEESKYSLLGVDIPSILVPVKPGRNVPIIIETATLNQRLKKMGTYSARQLDENLKEWLQKNK